MSTDVPFGPTGAVVFARTYSRTLPDGSKETWHQMCERVAYGNIALVHGKDPDVWSKEVCAEAWALKGMMERMELLPAGRHLWATGVEGRQYLSNCWASGWGEKVSGHFEFTSMRLFEGGGVGANYSTKHIEKYGAPTRKVDLYIASDEDHPDMDELRPYLTEVPPGVVAYHAVGDSREGWAAALTDLIDAFFAPEADYEKNVRLYDVQDIRPSGSPLVTSGGTASGPAPLARMLLDTAATLNRAYERGHLTPLDMMEIDHAIAEAVVSGGTRRSARMAIVHWNDPYILDFLACKTDTDKHWTTNISVEIDDEFLTQLGTKASATAVHEAVVQGMLKNGEPGYWNSTLNAEGEVNAPYCPNPCGEVILEQWEACNLGHINLDAFAPKPDGNGGRTWMDYDGMKEAHRLMTRFLLRATFSDFNDEKAGSIVAKNRRIGVGHLGVQAFWAKIGVKYADIPTSGSVSMLDTMYKIVRQEARDYAFQLRIPEPVKVTAVAPTGSVAKLPGTTEGIHPIYARWFERRVRFSMRDPDQANSVLEFQAQGFKVETDVYDKSGMTAVVVFPTEDLLVSQVRELGWREPESLAQSADEISIEDMLSVQRHYQEHWADNAVSYTVNIPEGAVTAEELAGILARFLPYLKGTTVMVDASRPQAPYTRITQSEWAVAAAKKVEDGTDEDCGSACPIR